MVPSSVYAGLIPHVAALLAYLVGLVVAIILLIRVKSKAAILAAVSFALLTLISIGQIVLALPPVSRQIFLAGQWLAWLLNCCCSIFDIAAIVCLIIAIWQAVSGTVARETAQEESTYATETREEEVTPGEIVEISEEAPEETTYATVKLEETLEGTAEFIEEAPPESSYATQVLEETQEEAAEE